MRDVPEYFLQAYIVTCRGRQWETVCMWMGGTIHTTKTICAAQTTIRGVTKKAGLRSMPRPMPQAHTPLVLFRGILSRFQRKAGKLFYEARVGQHSSDSKIDLDMSADTKTTSTNMAEAKGHTGRFGQPNANAYSKESLWIGSSF